MTDKLTVYTAVLDSGYGVDTRVFRTESEAYQWFSGVMRECLEDKGIDDTPDDDLYDAFCERFEGWGEVLKHEI